MGTMATHMTTVTQIVVTGTMVIMAQSAVSIISDKQGEQGESRRFP
jgi:hypothetical protein